VKPYRPAPERSPKTRETKIVTERSGDIANSNVGGSVEPGFELVRDAFVANFERGLEVGASCAVFVDGLKVVDLWGGIADTSTGHPWTEETLAPVNSVTKGATAICVALLIERGLLDPGLPVSTYWPEFSAAGKSKVTVRQMLSHSAGLPVIDGYVAFDDVFDGALLADRLASQRPIWAPGTTHGYHALTFGALADALVRRISGRSVGRFLADEVALPLNLDFYIGLPESEISRVSPLIDATPQTRDQVGASIEDDDLRVQVLALFDDLSDPSSLAARAGTLNGALSASRSKRKDTRFYTAEIPASNAITNARSLARLYAICVGTAGGNRLLSDATLASVTSEIVNGPDGVLHFPSRFALGFQLDLPNMPMLGPTSFGHPGAGGALGFADLGLRVGFGYVQNQMGGFSSEPRATSLVAALRRSLQNA
jgi:CubicO group peptidase (beta-lactamase class C family)